MKERRTATLDNAPPEGVTFSLPLAGPVTRSVACFLDYVAISVAWSTIQIFIQELTKARRDKVAAARAALEAPARPG